MGRNVPSLKVFAQMLREPVFPLGARAQKRRSESASDAEDILPWFSVLRDLLKHLDGEEEDRLYSLLLNKLLRPGSVEAGAICRTGIDDGPSLLVYVPGHEKWGRTALLHALRTEAEWEVSCPVAELWVNGCCWLSLGLYGQDQADALLLRLPAGENLGTVSRDSYERLAIEFSTLLKSVSQERSRRRQVLYQERALIARELHDSLAQSLSYLKIQVARLDALAREEETRPLRDASGVIRELDGRLNLAYRQLRELITTFRLTMHGRSLGEALGSSVEEFESRSGIAFQVDNCLSKGALSVDEEMQVLQIVREALSNAVRHSQAQQVRLSLRCNRDNEVCILVDDNGQGFPSSRGYGSGHGLTIMRQRVRDMNGRLSLERAPLGGARVCLRFQASCDASGAALSPRRVQRSS